MAAVAGRRFLVSCSGGLSSRLAHSPKKVDEAVSSPPLTSASEVVPTSVPSTTESVEAATSVVAEASSMAASAGASFEGWASTAAVSVVVVVVSAGAASVVTAASTASITGLELSGMTP